MRRLFPNFSILIHFLRILGHFPYTWKSENMIKHEDSYTRNSLRETGKIEDDIFISSAFWKVWSLVFCLVNTLLIIYNVAETKYLSEGRTYNIETIRVPYIIYDSLQYINLFAMNFLSMKSSYKLSKILNKLHAFLSTTKIETKSFWLFDLSWIAPYIGIVTVTALLLIVGKEQGSLFRNVYHLSCYLFITGISVLLVSIYASLFLGIFSTVGSLYEVVLSDFVNYAKYIEGKYDGSPLNVSYDKIKKSDAFAFVFTKSIKVDTVENLSNSLNNPDQKSETEITATHILRCKISLLQLYSFKRSIIDYFDTLIIVFMVGLISSIIISIFYISILHRNILEVFIPICHSIVSIVSLLCLLNAPYKIYQQVRLFYLIITFYNNFSNAYFNNWRGKKRK